MSGGEDSHDGGTPAGGNDVPCGGEAAGGGADGRRSFLGRLLMAVGLVTGYGYFVTLALRFLYPRNGSSRRWQFLATLSDFPSGTQREFRSPVGHRVLVTRISDAADASSFLALSDVCPHLGCRVHWEPQNNRFFCPCHNGAFDPSGKATAGPPADAGQTLFRYPIRVEGELVLIEVPVEDVRGRTA